MIKENLIEIYENSFRNNWNLLGLSDYSTKEDYHYKDIAREIARVHILLTEAGIKKGDKIALVGRNNIPWCITYLAAINYGAVIVPILQDFPHDSIQHIINHSDAKLLFTNSYIWDHLNEESLPEIRGAFSTNSMELTCLYQKDGERLTDLANSLDAKMMAKYPNGYEKEDIKYPKVDNSELIIISYTSGTTGFSKGVMLSANNIAGNLTHAKYLKLLFKEQRIISFLPLAHAYGCAFEFLFSLSEGAHTTLLGKAPSPKILGQAFADIKPHLIIAVPLIIEKIYKRAIVPKLEKSTIKAALKIPIVKDRLHAKFRNGLIEAMGGNFHEVIVGGAALNPEVEAFLHKIKFPFTVGYGMTECAPLVAYEYNQKFIPTSSGRVLDNIMEVRIDSDDPYNKLGEIQVRGENVMMGYYKNEEATQATFTEDGWLKTGDLGTINEDKHIFIRGRSKTMLLSSSGQNIFPEELESRLNNMPYVMESLVVERSGRLVALIHPDYEAMDPDGILVSDLERIMEANRQILNKQVASYESVASVQIFPNEFEKTPKKSIKRYLYEN